jgi:TPR repeat protein
MALMTVTGRKNKPFGTMWKRISASFASVLSKSMPAAAGATPQVAGGTQSAAQQASASQAHATANALKGKHFKELQASVATLSEGLSEQERPRTMPSTALLRQWQQQTIESTTPALDELTVEQIELLAKLNYEGRQSEEIEPNKKKAIDLWKIAADRGSLEARYSLAGCMRVGSDNHIDQDSSKAFAMMKDLADNHNYKLALYNIGIMYSKGEGVDKDDVKAFDYFKVGTPAMREFNSLAHYSFVFFFLNHCNTHITSASSPTGIRTCIIQPGKCACIGDGCAQG